MQNITIAGIVCPWPTCRLCNGPAKSYIVNPLNRNHNAGRPYYRCQPCEDFITFADARGIQPDNQSCGCGHPSRGQITRRDRTGARRFHFVCSIGSCNFYQDLKDQNGVEPAFTDEVQILDMVRRNLI